MIKAEKVNVAEKGAALCERCVNGSRFRDKISDLAGVPGRAVESVRQA